MEGWEDGQKPKNTLPLYGNKDSMNLNSMILSNIVGSSYFKEELIQYKTFHEVVDQIYYKVDHMEPWEKNSRKLAGQVGMCAGVRGVAAGGIVSTAFCILYKLFTLKLTRKQVTVMLNHVDSPYIRALGFLYVRYCQPPANFWDWFSPYIEDEEEINLKAGGGYEVTIGEMCRMMLTSLDWFGTLLPRLPVLIQKDINKKLEAFPPPGRNRREPAKEEPEERNGHDEKWGEAARRAKMEGGNLSPRRPRERRSRSRERQRPRSRERQRSRSRERPRSRSKERQRSRSKERQRSRSRERQRPRDRHDRQRNGSATRSRHSSRSRNQDRKHRSRSRDRHRQRSHSRERRRSRSHDRKSRRSDSNERSRRRSKERRGRSRSHDRKSHDKRSRSRERRR